MNSTNNNFANDILSNIFSGTETANNYNPDAVAELLEKFGLKWTVSKQPLLLPDGTPTDFFGIVRDDTKKTFSTCKDSYVPFQNSELAELLIRIADRTGYEIHSGGKFNGGGKVYLQLNTGNEIKNLGENRTTVKGYATGINSHDGTTALKWGAVNFTVCCKNTFAMAQKALQHTARHTNAIHQKVEDSIKQIHGIADLEKTIFDKFIKLSEIEVKGQNIARIVNTITGVDINLSKQEAESKFSTYSLNRTEELLNSISKEMKQKGHTLWGLFSGVTQYTSHVMPAPKRENARLESKYTGTGLNIDNTAFAEVLEMAEMN